MTFSYDLAGTAGATSRAVARIRLELGDQNSGAGVNPDGTNLSDEELLDFYGREANSVLGGAAHAAEALSRSWARMSDMRAGPLSQSFSQTSAAWAKQAETLRVQAGGGAPVFKALSSRQDGYAYRAGSVDVNP